MKGGACGSGESNELLLGSAATSLSRIERNCRPEWRAQVLFHQHGVAFTIVRRPRQGSEIAADCI
jgi:hypothetical protein